MLVDFVKRVSISNRGDVLFYFNRSPVSGELVVRVRREDRARLAKAGLGPLQFGADPRALLGEKVVLGSAIKLVGGVPQITLRHPYEFIDRWDPNADPRLW